MCEPHPDNVLRIPPNIKPHFMSGEWPIPSTQFRGRRFLIHKGTSCGITEVEARKEIPNLKRQYEENLADKGIWVDTETLEEIKLLQRRPPKLKRLVWAIRNTLQQ